MHYFVVLYKSLFCQKLNNMNYNAILNLLQGQKGFQGPKAEKGERGDDGSRVCIHINLQ